MKKLRYYYKELKAELAYLPKNLSYFFSIKKKAIYVGCTDMGNLGDEAILKAIKMMLDRHLYLYPISYNKPSSGKYFRKIYFKQPDYIILGGGTLIKKGKDESYLKTLEAKHLLYPKAKIVIIGPGVVNPDFARHIGFPIDISSWKRILNLSEFVSVRGQYSKEELDKWGLNKQVHVLHDPAIWFAKTNIKLKAKAKKIGLNFANIGNRIHGKDSSLVEKFAISFVQLLKGHGWEIYLYPTTVSDIEYMMENIGLKKIAGLNVYDNFKDLEASLIFIESLDVFVGQRLHSVVFSALVATPFIALEYEPKTSDFLKTINMNNSLFKVDNLDEDIIFNKLTQVYENIHAEQRIIFDLMMKAKAEQKKCLDLLLAKIK